MKEKLIAELYKCIDRYGRTDYRTVAASQRVDVVIVAEQLEKMKEVER